jgi:hypothetical protein
VPNSVQVNEFEPNLRVAHGRAIVGRHDGIDWLYSRNRAARRQPLLQKNGRPRTAIFLNYLQCAEVVLVPGPEQSLVCSVLLPVFPWPVVVVVVVVV